MIKVIGLGAGGHAKVVIDILRRVGDYELVGLLDPKEDLWGSEIEGVKVLGGDPLLPELFGQAVTHAFIGLGSVADTYPRQRLYEAARRHGFQIVRAIHPQSVVSATASIGHGPTIMPTSVVNAGATLGDNVIVNTGAIVEHDCVIGDHVHLATGARLCSTVQVGEGAHIGAGATVRQVIRIGEGAAIGAGSVVVKDVEPGTVVVGVPARLLRHTGYNTPEGASNMAGESH